LRINGFGKTPWKILLACVFLLSCGIEDYPYIYPIPVDNLRQESNYQARIIIPNSNLGNMYFSHFAIFYRLYISDIYEQSPSESNFGTINSTLNSDYNRVKPYIGNDSMGSSSIASLFNNMNYYTLAVEGEISIDSVLSTSSFNRTLLIDFSQTPGSIPYLTVGSATQYRLQRSDGGGNFELLPEHGYFTNSPELRNPANISESHINADITDLANAINRRYTYIAMYIVAIGFEPQTYVQLYSSPVFAGVVSLPD
jgi:hypothetical protein